MYMLKSTSWPMLSYSVTTNVAPYHKRATVARNWSAAADGSRSYLNRCVR